MNSAPSLWASAFKLLQKAIGRVFVFRGLQNEAGNLPRILIQESLDAVDVVEVEFHGQRAHRIGHTSIHLGRSDEPVIDRKNG